MRAFRSVTLALAFATGLASMVAAQSPTPQPLHYWHVWVDSAGMTHQTQCEFKDFSPLSLGKDVEPIFVDKLKDAFTGHEPDNLIFTNLSDEQEAALREVFDGV